MICLKLVFHIIFNFYHILDYHQLLFEFTILKIYQFNLFYFIFVVICFHHCFHMFIFISIYDIIIKVDLNLLRQMVCLHYLQNLLFIAVTFTNHKHYSFIQILLKCADSIQLLYSIFPYLLKLKFINYYFNVLIFPALPIYISCIPFKLQFIGIFFHLI